MKKYKKYRHRITGKIAHEHTGGGYNYEDKEGVCIHIYPIPKELVENSCDWIELKQEEYLQTTADGKELYNGEEYWFVSANLEGVSKIKAVPFDITSSHERDFSTKEAAEQWVLKKKSVKLFTTHDGKDIYEGDSYAFIIRNLGEDYFHKDWEIREQNHALPQHVSQDKAYPGKYINFSSRAAAEEYKLMNQPLLSLNDISNSWQITNDGNYVHGTNTFKKLKELAKSRI